MKGFKWFCLYRKALIRTFHTSFVTTKNLCEFKALEHKIKRFLVYKIQIWYGKFNSNSYLNLVKISLNLIESGCRIYKFIYIMSICRLIYIICYCLEKCKILNRNYFSFKLLLITNRSYLKLCLTKGAYTKFILMYILEHYFVY